MSQAHTLFAPAKINLYLHVTGKREDGYHLLDSMMAFADVGDSVTITPADRLSLAVTGHYAEHLQQESYNIVLKAAELLAFKLAVQPNVAIHLKKELPVAAGLGGGSSDAATALLLLAKMWDAHITPEALTDIGLKLGADVPVCLKRQAAFVSGIGDTISIIDPFPTLNAVLVNPNVALSTAAVFNARQHVSEIGQLSNSISMVHNGETHNFSQQSLLTYICERRNDLEPAAKGLAPVIHDCLEQIAQTEGCVFSRMSGSGSTCFGLYSDALAAEEAATALHQQFPDWWVKPTTIGHCNAS